MTCLTPFSLHSPLSNAHNRRDASHASLTHTADTEKAPCADHHTGTVFCCESFSFPTLLYCVRYLRLFPCLFVLLRRV
jgi:hypothetical protein